MRKDLLKVFFCAQKFRFSYTKGYYFSNDVEIQDDVSYDSNNPHDDDVSP